MGQAFTLLIVVIVALVKFAGKNKDGKRSEKRAAARELSPAPKGARRRAAQQAQAELWREAKHKQDDAAQVHSIHMDACESRLESLRVLYDAGVLDREEYAQRVARVKEKHFKKEA